MPLRVSARVAITAQQFCSIETAITLCVSDGISKTAVWKKQDVRTLELRRCKNVPAFGTTVPTAGKGLHLLNHHSRQETQICASRRSPR